MQSRMLRALLFVAALSVFAADFTVGCGHGYVYGPVTQKYLAGADTGAHLILVNGTTYDVPVEFFTQVRVGDIVKFDGRNWTVVKHAQRPGTSVAAHPLPSIPL